MSSVRLSDSSKSSFSFTSYGNTPAATPTDVLVMKGAALTLIKIRRILISGLATTAGDLPFDLIRRSTAGSGGTKTSPTTAAARDKNDGTPRATFDLYTANPTVGTAVKTLLTRNLALLLAGAIKDRAEIFPGRGGMKPIYLDGVADFLAFNFKGGTLPAGAKLDFEIDWTEE